jgi:2-polyprenyl-3-methyl-5-hydroxy-6-metoxy-1,4-benzoquinol methylase
LHRFKPEEEAHMDTAQFDLHAKIEDIHWWFRARREIIFSVLKRYVPVNQDMLLAEIGCGTGGNLKYFKKYYRVTGSDISPEAVKYASGCADCNVRLGDFRDVLAGQLKEAEAVMLADVLEHIEDDAFFIKDVVDLVKQNAIILITVPAHMSLWSPHDAVLGHHRRYSVRALRALWAGLEAEEIYFSPFNSLLFPGIALYRLLKTAGSGEAASDLSLPSRWINYLLYRIFVAERILMRLFPLPFGISYMAVLRKGKQ